MYIRSHFVCLTFQKSSNVRKFPLKNIIMLNHVWNEILKDENRKTEKMQGKKLFYIFLSIYKMVEVK